MRGFFALPALILILQPLLLSGAHVGSQAEQLQQEVDQLQSLTGIKDPAVVFEVQLGLATRYQALNTLKPDGGSRLAAADQAYRKAYDLAQAAGHASDLATVCTNWGALLIDTSQIDQALAIIDDGLHWSSKTPEGTLRTSLLFNKAKALAIAGRQRDAQHQYDTTATAAYGRDLTSFAKAVAAMSLCPFNLLAQVLATLQHLGYDVLRSGHAPATRQSDVQPCIPWTLLQRLRHDTPHTCPPHPACYAPMLYQRVDGAIAALYNTDRSWLSQATVEDTAWLCFASHKALASLPLADLSWAALSQGNSLMAQQHPYSPATDWQYVNILKHVFSGSFTFPAAASPSTHPSSPAAPIFIVGMPRSGSTLLESLLASHRYLLAERVMAVVLLPGCHAGARDVIAAGEDTAFAPLSQRVSVLVDDAFARGDPQLSSIRHQLDEVGQEYTQRMCARFVPPGTPCGSVHVVDKMLRNLWLAGHIRLALPGACMIHVVRHPLDAGLSCYQQPFLSPSMSWSWDLSHIAEQIRLTWAIAQHWAQVMPGWVHTVLYEELVAQPRATLRRVLSACGLPWQADLLSSFHLKQRSVSTASMDQVRRPLFNSSVGAWKRYEAQLKPLREAVGDQLVEAYDTMLAARLEQL